MNSIKNFFWNKGSSVAYAIATAIFTVVPENIFLIYKTCNGWPDSVNVMVNRLAIGFILIILGNIVYYIYSRIRKSVLIKGDNYSIKIEYGDILNLDEGKKVVAFDECFTTHVGEMPSDIKEESVCGQYLKQHPISDIQTLIDSAGIKPTDEKSAFNQQTRYKSGTIVPNGDFLLMAFTKLDVNGRSYMTYEDYINCLDTLWEQIDLYHGTKDVYITILGSNITRFNTELSQQELLDLMISSYRLSPMKLHTPYQLHIICKKRDGFSLNKIFGIG